MGAFFLTSPSSINAPNKLVRFSDTHNRTTLLVEKKKRVFHISCNNNSNNNNSNVNPKRPIRVSSVVKERGQILVSEQSSSSPSVMEAERLVLSANGKGTAEIKSVQDLVPFHGSSSLVDFQEGLGIVNFLKGKSFFITGATGFLAKVLIEKILRAAPEVGKIYLLIKAKNKAAAAERLNNEILDTELFEILKQRHGKSFHEFVSSKLVPVVGNGCESDLGLAGDSAAEIAEVVDVIVNSAANTTFDERYDVALDINTRGPCHLMRFAKKCKQLKLFLQVSTAYANGQRQGRIMEKPFSMGDCIANEIYSTATRQAFMLPLDVENEMKLVLNAKKGLEEHEKTQRMKELGLERARRYGWQDTYVFTKALGEMMVNSMRGEIPVVIIRPSVIESTCSQPFPGWMEGNRMMDPIVLYYGKGQLTGFLVDPKAVLDVVPADMVVNATLAAIAKHGMTPKPEINVYQIASSVVNPLVFEDLALHLHRHYNSNPCLDSKGVPIVVPSMKLFNSMQDFSDQLWKDAYQRSGLTALGSSDGKMIQKLEAVCRKSVEQAKYLANIYEPYTFYGGRFDNSNMQRLMESMSKEEKMEFGFDVGSIDWKDYITNVHIPGLRRHVMKGRGSSNSP